MKPIQRFITPTLNDIWVFSGGSLITGPQDLDYINMYNPVQIQEDEYGDLSTLEFYRGDNPPSTYAHNRDFEDENLEWDELDTQNFAPELTPQEKLEYKAFRMFYMALAFFKDLPELPEMLVALEI